ncbi:hypothetical protein DdX_15226 [Ditylenchus destructor]|uniref:Uncharacterized protein n=1 Tax=Ditylenchus destructor TaxID=166010 RepID=A0AAD4MVP1_9BILA|nr:hypothetical protein DdX_15226 [Ditylenchus destructor]
MEEESDHSQLNIEKSQLNEPNALLNAPRVQDIVLPCQIQEQIGVEVQSGNSEIDTEKPQSKDNFISNVEDTSSQLKEQQVEDKKISPPKENGNFAQHNGKYQNFGGAKRGNNGRNNGKPFHRQGRRSVDLNSMHHIQSSIYVFPYCGQDYNRFPEQTYTMPQQQYNHMSSLPYQMTQSTPQGYNPMMQNVAYAPIIPGFPHTGQYMMPAEQQMPGLFDVGFSPPFTGQQIPQAQSSNYSKRNFARSTGSNHDIKNIGRRFDTNSGAAGINNDHHYQQGFLVQNSVYGAPNGQPHTAFYGSGYPGFYSPGSSCTEQPYLQLQQQYPMYGLPYQFVPPLPTQQWFNPMPQSMMYHPAMPDAEHTSQNIAAVEKSINALCGQKYVPHALQSAEVTAISQHVQENDTSLELKEDSEKAVKKSLALVNTNEVCETQDGKKAARDKMEEDQLQGNRSRPLSDIPNIDLSANETKKMPAAMETVKPEESKCDQVENKNEWNNKNRVDLLKAKLESCDQNSREPLQDICNVVDTIKLKETKGKEQNAELNSTKTEEDGWQEVKNKKHKDRFDTLKSKMGYRDCGNCSMHGGSPSQTFLNRRNVDFGRNVHESPSTAKRAWPRNTPMPLKGG